MLEVYSILEGRAPELRAAKTPCDHAALSSDNPMMTPPSFVLLNWVICFTRKLPIFHVYFFYKKITWASGKIEGFYNQRQFIKIVIVSRIYLGILQCFWTIANVDGSYNRR